MKQINYILILLQLCCITACNDWLEVAPQAEKEESEMFEKEAGFDLRKYRNVSTTLD